MMVILPITKYVHLNSLSSKQLCGKKKMPSRENWSSKGLCNGPKAVEFKPRSVRLQSLYVNYNAIIQLYSKDRGD